MRRYSRRLWRRADLRQRVRRAEAHVRAAAISRPRVRQAAARPSHQLRSRSRRAAAAARNRHPSTCRYSALRARGLSSDSAVCRLPGRSAEPLLREADRLSRSIAQFGGPRAVSADEMAPRAGRDHRRWRQRHVWHLDRACLAHACRVAVHVASHQADRRPDGQSGVRRVADHWRVDGLPARCFVHDALADRVGGGLRAHRAHRRVRLYAAAQTPDRSPGSRRLRVARLSSRGQPRHDHRRRAGGAGDDRRISHGGEAAPVGLTSPIEERETCLNCSAGLSGRFCSACGQRAVPPNPTVRELAGDAWNELSGYDGRIAATFRGLLKPGLLTRRYLEGQRAHFLSPVRLYLIVSLVYFLVAAAAPNLDSGSRGASVGPGIRIGVTGAGNNGMLTDEDRRELLKDLENAPWLLRPMLQAIANDPAAFRRNLFTVMPRVFFGLLPVFAGMVALFYRGYSFPTALVFAVHLHAFGFAALTFSELSKFTGSRLAASVVGGVVLIILTGYVFKAFRAVFGGSVGSTIGKMTGIGLLYVLASIPAFLIILMWAAVS